MWEWWKESLNINCNGMGKSNYLAGGSAWISQTISTFSSLPAPTMRILSVAQIGVSEMERRKKYRKVENDDVRRKEEDDNYIMVKWQFSYCGISLALYPYPSTK